MSLPFLLPSWAVAVCLPFGVFFPILAAAGVFCFSGKGGRSARGLFPYLVTVCALTLAGSLLPLAHIAAGGQVPPADFLGDRGAPGGFHFTADFFRALYGVVCAFLFTGSAVFSPRYFGDERHLPRYGFFFLLTFGATMGVFYASDLLTCFCFFEVLSLASVLLVVQEQTARATSAAATYLAVSIFGGLVLFLGIVYLYSITGTLTFSALAPALHGKLRSVKLWIAGVCLLLGFGAKAGMFPLHIWLPKAHPAAPAPASALLSGILTKVGVFGIILTIPRLFAGERTMALLLMTLASVTMLLGALLGVLSTDLKRTLACSSMSQIGFILSGVAAATLEPSALSSSGTVLHMLNHSCIKLVLFLAAGAIYQNAHTLDLTRLRGVCNLRAKGKGRAARIFLAVCFLVGALDISGIPLFGGYLSKTLLHEAVAEVGVALGGAARAFEWVFLFSGGLTLAYMCKLFVCLFLEKPLPDGTAPTRSPSPLRKRRMNPSPRAAYASVSPREGASSSFPKEEKPTVASAPSAPAPFSLGAGQVIVLSLATLLLLPMGAPGPMLALGRRAGTVLSGKGLFYEGEIFGGEALSGIAISAAIGLAVYFLLVRTLLIRRGEYRDVLPAWLDLETRVYRPAVTLLTRVGTALARVPDKIGQGVDAIAFDFCRVGGVVARFFDKIGEGVDALAAGFCSLGNILSRLPDTLVDGVVYLLQRTVFRPVGVRGRPHTAGALGDAVGHAADILTGREGHTEILAREKLRLREGRRRLTGSFYFTMAAACIGIVVIILFVLAERYL